MNDGSMDYGAHPDLGHQEHDSTKSWDQYKFLFTVQPASCGRKKSFDDVNYNS